MVNWLHVQDSRDSRFLSFYVRRENKNNRSSSRLMFTVALAERHERKKKSLVFFFLPSVSYSYHVTSVSFDASTVCLVFIPDMEPWITSITLIPRCFTIAPVKEQSSFRKVPLISLHRLSAHKKTQLQAVACVTWSKRGKKRWKMAKW